MTRTSVLFSVALGMLGGANAFACPAPYNDPGDDCDVGAGSDICYVDGITGIYTCDLDISGAGGAGYLEGVTPNVLNSMMAYGTDSGGTEFCCPYTFPPPYPGPKYLNVFGGPGDDVIQTNSNFASVKVWAGSGNDTVEGGVGLDKLYGENGNDTIHGNSSADTIDGGSGDDLLYGESGDDFIEGNTGKDSIWGGDGNDRCSVDFNTTFGATTTNNQYVHGDGGNDTINGANGTDFLNGDDGTNTLYGYGGTDEMCAGSGDDKLYGGTGDDSLHGGGGTNVVSGETHILGDRCDVNGDITCEDKTLFTGCPWP